MVFWQSISGKWNQLLSWCLQKSASKPSGAPEGAIWYDTTNHRATIENGQGSKNIAHYEELNRFGGVVTKPTITKGSGGSITVGNDGVFHAYSDASFSGAPVLYSAVGGTYSIPAGADYFLTFRPGTGYSVEQLTGNTSGILSNDIPVARCQYFAGRLHITMQGRLGRGLPEQMALREALTNLVVRINDEGMILSLNGLVPSISGAEVFASEKIEIVPFVGGTNTLYKYTVSNGSWAEAVATAIDTSIYNPLIGQASLPAGKFAWAYIYRSIGNDIEAFVLYGNEYFVNEAKAREGFKMLTTVNPVIQKHCVPVGFVLYEQGATSALSVISAWGTSAIGGSVAKHNDLSNIDAGDPTIPYYGHVKQIDNTRMNAAGSANGYALLGSDGKVPSGQLPSYVDDVLEYATKANFPATGESGKIYVDLATNLTWRWSGSAYVEISPSLALGETNATAYRGDRGKIAYDHSQITSANPHGTTASQIASTATGDVSATNVQAAIAELASGKQPLDSTLTALSGLSSGIPLLTSDTEATSINRATLVESLRANSVISGGGIIYVNSTFFIKWSSIFIIISNGNGSHFSTTGYFQIAMPDVGTEITGLGTTSKTVTSDGIELGAWDALYYILPIGLDDGTRNANFRLVNYLYSAEIPETWIPLALRNAAFGYVQFPNGVCLHAGETKSDPWQKQINAKQPLDANLTNLAANNTAGILVQTGAETYESRCIVAGTGASVANGDGVSGNPTVSVKYGTTAGTACQGNDSRLSDARTPTSHASTATTYGVGSYTNYGHAMASSAPPAMNGTVSTGVDNGKYAREGHVHPTDTNRAPASMTINPILGPSGIDYDGDGSLVYFIECHYSNIKYLLLEVAKKATRATSNVVALSSGTTLSTVSNGTTYTLPQYGTATISHSAGNVGDRIFFTVTGCSSGTITVNGISKSGGQGYFGIIAEKCALGWCVC